MVAEWVAAHDGRGARALNRIVLRSLKQAYYDNRNRGHAGLQLRSYCHFTSPIRRYPDLICHRALLVGGRRIRPAPEASFVAAAGPSDLGARARGDDGGAGRRRCRACFLLREVAGGGPGRSVRGRDRRRDRCRCVRRVRDQGEYEGMLAVRRLRGDWWELNEQGTALVGTRSGGAMRLGRSDLGAGRRDGRAPWPGRPGARRQLRRGLTWLAMAKGVNAK